MTKIEYNYQDTIISVLFPSEEQSSKISDSDSSYLETSIAESWAKWVNGSLYHKLRNKSEIPYLYPVNMPKIEVTTSNNKTLVNTVYVERELKSYEKFLMSCGAISILLIICLIILKFRNSKT